MKIKNKGYIVPVAIGILVVASLGLLFFSKWGGSQKANPVPVSNEASVASTTRANIAADNALKASMANDDATLDADSANIDTQLKALDSSNSEVDSSLNDKSSI